MWIKIELSQAKIRKNFDQFKKLSSWVIYPVLKWDWYWLGIKNFFRIFPDIVWVSVFDFSEFLISISHNVPHILVLKSCEWLADLKRYIQYSVNSSSVIYIPFSNLTVFKECEKILNKHSNKLNPILNVSTWINRTNLPLNQINNTLSAKFCWYMTHFFDGENTKPSTFNREQINFIKNIADDLPKSWTFESHQNSSALYRGLDKNKKSISRLWIWLFWLASSCDFKNIMENLENPLKISSSIHHISKLNKGEIIGYWWKYKLDKTSTIVYLSSWYADGLLRGTIWWSVLINNHKSTVIDINMNYCVIKIDQGCHVNQNDEVFFSLDEFTLNDALKDTTVLPQEILTNLKSDIKLVK